MKNKLFIIFFIAFILTNFTAFVFPQAKNNSKETLVRVKPVVKPTVPTAESAPLSDFTEIPVNLTGVYSSSVAWGDYDNDGLLDILLTGTDSVNIISKIYHNNGNGQFSENTSISLPGVFSGSANWVDYDNDGWIDIFLTGDSYYSTLISKIYHNDANGQFSENTNSTLPGIFFSSASWGDYDNDGRSDILMVGLDNNFTPISKIFNNNSNGQFLENTNTALPGVKYASVGWGDYDNDGRLDILLTGKINNSTSISKIYHNEINGLFSENTSVVLPGVFCSSASWGDYDNDGWLDILLTGAADNDGTLI